MRQEYKIIHVRYTTSEEFSGGCLLDLEIEVNRYINERRNRPAGGREDWKPHDRPFDVEGKYLAQVLVRD